MGRSHDGCVITLPRLALALTLAGLVPGAAPASAAVGLVYTDNQNIQASTVDGATKTSFTNDGSSERNHWDVAQAADGTVFSSTLNTQNSLKQFIGYSPLGAKISEYTAAYKPGYTLYAYPLGFEVDATKSNIAYGYSVSTLNTFDRGTWVAPSGHSAGNPPFEKSGLQGPTFFGSRLVGVSGSQVLVQDASGQPPYSNDYTPWLAAGGTIELKRVPIAPNGTTYAVEYVDTGPEPDVGGIELHRHEGAPIPGGTDTIACEFPTEPNPEHVSFSPDSTLMTWKDDGGVKVARVPDLTAPGASCPPPAPPVVISTTGRSPALGGIDVPALIASRTPPPPPDNRGPDGTKPDGTGPDGTGPDGTGGADRTPPRLTFASVRQAKLAAALKSGVAFKLTLSEACALKADLLLPAKVAKKLQLKRKVGTSRASLRAGANTVKVKATKAAQKKLKRQRSLKLSLSGTCTDAAGNAARVGASATLKK